MSKIITLIAAFSFVFSVDATVHDISVSNNTFTPSSGTFSVGDTVRFTLTAGNHTTTSVSVPNGAATWNYTFPNGLGTTFEYKITVVGSYSYKCSFHNGMVGSFEAIDNTAGIIQEKEINSFLKASPNPFKGKISIPNKTANSIEIRNILGEKVKTISVDTDEKLSHIDLSDLKKGVYFYVLKQDELILESRKIIKSE